MFMLVAAFGAIAVAILLIAIFLVTVTDFLLIELQIDTLRKFLESGCNYCVT